MYLCRFEILSLILMRLNKPILLLFFLAGFLLHGTAQNVTLVVTTTNGEEQSFQLPQEGQLYFENGDQLIINDGTGTVATFQLANIQKMVCTEVTLVEENATSALQLIPNPARDCFFIKNLQSSTEARLYAIDGRLVKTFKATEGMMVDISDMVPGMYLLHIDDQTLKMIKQ